MFILFFFLAYRCFIARDFDTWSEPVENSASSTVGISSTCWDDCLISLAAEMVERTKCILSLFFFLFIQIFILQVSDTRTVSRFIVIKALTDAAVFLSS